MDCVAHCGDVNRGSYVNSLVLTDIAGVRPLIVGPGLPSRVNPCDACVAPSCAGVRLLIVGPGQPSRDCPGVACDALSTSLLQVRGNMTRSG